MGQQAEAGGQGPNFVFWETARRQTLLSGSNFNEHTFILLLFLRPGFVLSNQVPRVNLTEVFLKTEIDKEEMNRGRLMFPFIFMKVGHD